MKQTKPFGKPAGSVSHTPSVVERNVEKKREAPTPFSDGRVDVYQSTVSQGVEQKGAVNRDISRFTKAAIFAVLGFPLALWASVAIRDSVAIGAVLQEVVSRDATMICKDGKVIYADYSIADRLLDRGSLQCTEWRVNDRWTRVNRFIKS